MYTAMLMSGDFHKSGFKTEEAAWDYVYSTMCNSCCNEYERELTGNYNKEDEEDWPFYPCEAEWSVLLTAEYESLGNDTV